MAASVSLKSPAVSPPDTPAGSLPQLALCSVHSAQLTFPLSLGRQPSPKPGPSQGPTPRFTSHRGPQMQAGTLCQCLQGRSPLPQCWVRPRTGRRPTGETRHTPQRFTPQCSRCDSSGQRPELPKTMCHGGLRKGGTGQADRQQCGVLRARPLTARAPSSALVFTLLLRLYCQHLWGPLAGSVTPPPFLVLKLRSRDRKRPRPHSSKMVSSQENRPRESPQRAFGNR